MRNVNFLPRNIFQARRINSEDLKNLVHIHKVSFSKDHFTANFNFNLLEKYYSCLINYHKYCIILEDDKKQIVGYLIAGYKVDIPIKNFIKKNFLSVSTALLTNPRFILEKLIEIFKRIFNLKKVEDENIVSVYIITMNPEVGYKGAGKILLEEFEKILLSENIDYYVLSVRKENKLAINFYKKNNFTLIGSNSNSLIFSKTIPHEYKC